MRRSGGGALVAGLAVLMLSGQGARAESVTLMQAYTRMMTAGIETGIIDADLAASAEGVKQAKGQRLPRVQLSLQYDQIQQEVISSDNETYAEGSSQYPKVTFNFSVRQPIYDAVRFRALPLARAQDAVRQADAEVARNRIVRDMIVAYFEVAQAQMRIRRAQAIIEGRADYVRSVEEDVAAGRREADVLIRAQGDSFAAESDRMEAEIGLAEALAGLQRYAGLDVTGVALDGARLGVVDLANIDRSMTEAALLSMSPDLQSAKAAADVGKRQIASARGALQPTVDLVLDFEHQTTEGSLFGGGSKTQTVTGGAMLTVPIYEGGIRKSRVREAEAGLRAADLKVQQTERAVLARYKALIGAARATAARSGKLSSQLRLSEESVAAAQEQFDAGRASEGVLLEQRLRRDTLRLDVQSARLQQFRVQAELYALFGALDMKAISAQAGS